MYHATVDKQWIKAISGPYSKLKEFYIIFRRHTVSLSKIACQNCHVAFEFGRRLGNCAVKWDFICLNDTVYTAP